MSEGPSRAEALEALEAVRHLASALGVLVAVAEMILGDDKIPAISGATLEAKPLTEKEGFEPSMEIFRSTMGDADNSGGER